MNRTTLAQQAKTANVLPPAQGIFQRKCAYGNHTPASWQYTEYSKESGTSIQRSAVSNQPSKGGSLIAPKVQQSDSGEIRIGKSNEKRRLSPVSTRTFAQKQNYTHHRPVLNRRSNAAASIAKHDENAVSRGGKSPIDVLSNEGDIFDDSYIDQAAHSPPASGPALATPAQPTNLLQLLTGWAPGPNRYGFQLKFRCRSTSGSVQDLQNQAPNLIWRERVTYSRNDFAGRINPRNPTILPTPPGGISFTAANTRRVGPNLLEFSNATDTHWMPTTAVRANDFRPAGSLPPPGFIGPLRSSLPAVMESRQVYQYSQNGGSTWRYLAGAFIIRRTLYGSAGNLRFRIQKTGVHTTTENYKP